MRLLYLLLLRLYPRETRERFGAEMLSVFTQSAAGRRGMRLVRFAAVEYAGLIRGAWSESPRRAGFTRALGAVGIAAMLHAGFLAVFGRFTAGVSAMAEGREPPPVLMLGIYAVISVLCLVPVILFAAMRLDHRRRRRC